MAAVGFCGLKPLLFRRKTCASEAMKWSNTTKKPSKAQKEASKYQSVECSFVGADQLISMMEIQKKILCFRDIMDLSPCNNAAPLRELVIKTHEDLHRRYPAIVPKDEVSEIKDKPIDKSLAYFCKALKSVGELWIVNNDWMDKPDYQLPSCKDAKTMGEAVLATLECMIKMANDKFDPMDTEFSPTSSSFGKFILGSSSFTERTFSCGSSPVTPTSVLPELIKYSTRAGDSPTSACTSPLLWSLRAQAVGKLNPIDVKGLSFHMTPCVEILNSKIEEEPSEEEMELDDEPSNADSKYSSDHDLVFDIDTTEELDRTIDEDKEKAKSQELSPNPEPQPLLQQPATPSPPQPPTPQKPAVLPVNVAAVPPPPISTPNIVPPPPPTPAPAPAQPVLTKNVAAPPPPPPPPPPRPSSSLSAPKLQKNATSSAMPPPPPPLPQSSGSGSAALAPPPPPPIPLKGGSFPAPPPPLPLGNGGGPPPRPPLGAGRNFRATATTRLKRSTQIRNLYRTLEGKVEGSNLKGKSSGGRKAAVGASASAGGKQGMADALAEMTKRSSYFQQIEEDVQKYSKQITELRPAITNFKTSEMLELVKFHKQVESILENLTDESQVLSRFEGFPTKKLEEIRMAAALYKKLDSILVELQNWKILPPLGQLLDKVERYFNKIKIEIDALDRSKDEEVKKFKSHNIEFDFHVLVKIKEAMVDVSSNCMELALKERREVATNNEAGPKGKAKAKECGKILWRAFQFAFRVYTFAGGHDDRADRLTRELAQEIEKDPYHT